MRKNLTTAIFFNCTFLLLYLYYSLFIWQVLGNAVKKHQSAYRYALVLNRSYFDEKYLETYYNTSHKFWDQSPSPYYQCCLQVSETVSCHKFWYRYTANILQHWVGGRGLIYFWKVDHSRIFINFSRNWLGLNDLCEIL